MGSKKTGDFYLSWIESCPDALVILQDEQYKYVSASFTAMFGYSPQDVEKGLSFFRLVQKKDRSAVKIRYIDRLVGKEAPATYRIDLIAKDGRIVPCETSASMIYLEGRPADLVIIRDISERREIEQKYRLLIETIPNGLQEIDTNGLILYANSAYHSMLGYDEGELTRRPIWDIVLEADHNALRDYIQFLIRERPDPVPYFNRCRKKNGDIIDVRVDWNYLTSIDGNVTGFISAISDVSQIKRIENEIKESHDMLESRVAERTKELESVNRKLLNEISARREKERALYENEKKFRNLSREFHLLLNAIPDSLILLSKGLEIIWANKAFETRTVDSNYSAGGKHCYSICCGISEPCVNCPVTKCFESGKEESTEVIDSDGKIFDKRAFPVIDEAGTVSSVLEISRDITAKKRMEEEAKTVQSRLIQANKMTSLGMIVSGVAHEINNPNSFIMSNAQVFSRLWKDIAEVLDNEHRTNRELSLGEIPFDKARYLVPKLLDGINEGSIRIKNIVESLKGFARPDRSGLDGRVNLYKVLMSSRAILEHHIDRMTSNFNIQCDKDIPVIRGNSQQIEQVLINLIMNALHSLPDKRSGVTITAGFNREADAVDVTIEDQGIGMDKDVLKQITDPFFTTKSELGGTGLGLSISCTIIKDHGGTISFESSPGNGTTVKFTLPSDKRQEKPA